MFAASPALRGAAVKSPDLRGGAALVMAGLVAEGETIVSAIHHIDRGYEGFVEKLVALGADAQRTTIPDRRLYRRIVCVN